MHFCRYQYCIASENDVLNNLANQRDGLHWSITNTFFKDWPEDNIIFHASLFVKSTKPTNIFKLGAKETDQCAPTIIVDTLDQILFTVVPMYF